jgi:DNA ligase-1
MEIVYKIDSKGKLRYIAISTESNLVVQTSGIVGTDSPVTNKSECIAKNIGKVNATTAEEQAVIEATAKVKKKLEEGYYSSPEEAQEGDLILPMLAKDFKKEEKKVRYPAYAQPKLDGMRCLKSQEVLRSRKNKVIDTMSHIAQELLEFTDILDGELYAHGDNFQRNMELIKKYRPGESELIKYHVYDVVMDAPFSVRYLTLQTILENVHAENIELVPTVVINSKEELLAVHKENLEKGYEGTMVRWGSEGYQENKRSSSLLKFKDFQDIACRIRDVKPSEKRPDQGSFICEMPDKKWVKRNPSGIIIDISDFQFEGADYDYPTFGCGMRFSQEEKQDVINNPQNYIGQIAEIRFFELSDLGIPRFPVCVGLRLDK